MPATPLTQGAVADPTNAMDLHPGRLHTCGPGQARLRASTGTATKDALADFLAGRVSRAEVE